MTEKVEQRATRLNYISGTGRNSRLFALRLILSLLVVLVAGFQLRHMVTWPPRKLAVHGALLDDAYFYEVLSRNYWIQGTLSLDGEMPTNGVQPMWMLVQTLLTKVLPDADGVTLLSRSSWVFYELFAFLLIWFVSRSSSYWTVLLSVCFVSAAIVLNVNFQGLTVRGLETPLLLFALAVSFFAIERFDKREKSGNVRNIDIVILALSVSLVFLSRTDLFWLCFLVAIWLMILDHGISWKVLLYLFSVSLLTLPYLLFNCVSQNSLMPISGRVKLFYLHSFYPTIHSYLGSDEWKGLFFAFKEVYALPGRIELSFFNLGFAVPLFVFLVGLSIMWRQRDNPVFPRSMHVFTLLILAHTFYMQFVYRELRPYSAYYFVPEILWSILACSYYLAHVIGNDGLWHRVRDESVFVYVKRAFSVLAILLVLGMCVSLSYRHKIRPSLSFTQRMRLCEDIKRIVPENESVGAFWPGFFAEFSGRRIIPLDGVIGSDEYFREYVVTGREIDYLLEKSTKFLAVYISGRPERVLSETIPSIYSWSQIGELRVWKYRHKLKIVAKRTWFQRKIIRGWYLFKITELPIERDERQTHARR